jgi:ATP-binding cassette subfamily B protein RaxB
MIPWTFFNRHTVPVVTMLAESECGLACLASISGYYNGAADMPAIRAACGHSGREVSLLHLRKVAEAIGFSARALRCEPAGLKRLRLPAVLHWEMNHFVVAERADATGLAIVDPALGRMTVPWGEVDRCFTGIALEVTPTETFAVRTGPRKRPSIRGNRIFPAN